ncbi:D-alanyl-D-alanine carboxypeptidase [Sphingopyxis sp. DHUNG17]|uniref:D-alanyl-D-alanine carboxypeptidase family protein n=1 Tax=Sphingopyxis jiangsuensis TaxID=2871171 RepID=UPI00191DEBC9|nr:D-alanyl-D-alanine carboxypeptidase family protein [Sphingopyxis lutea]MBL0767511.1 D-alanyl-D-alanine carboxypeptidase [Sphingopyxis lutea]
MNFSRVLTRAGVTAVLFAALSAATLAPAPARGDATPARPATRPLYVTEAPIVMLKDADSGAILFSRGADKRFAPASMTKVMTAYVVLDLIAKGELARDQQFTMTEALWKKWNGSTGGSTMFLRAGEKVSVDQLLKGLITVSGNDAAALLAAGIDGSEQAFVRRMNKVAAELGMSSSRFGTPNGWPDGGVTKVSAADLITLADRLIRDFPADYDRYFAIPRLQHGKAPDSTPIVQPNRNPILGRFAGADGLKTGHTAEAGYCFLGSARRDGRRLIMVVAGMGSEKARRDEAERLMRWGFEEWEGRLVAPAGKVVGHLDVNGGTAPMVAVETPLPIRVTVPKGFSGGYRAVMRGRAPQSAPVGRRVKVADLVVTPTGLPPQITPLVATSGVEATDSLWSRSRTGLYRLTGR